MNPPQVLSVIVPLYNEIETFAELHRRLIEVLQKIGCPFEVIYVDDGSRDGTFELIKQAGLDHPQIKYLSFSRNFGHQAAVSAGIDYTTGDTVAILDGDLQDPPEVLPHFLEKLKGGFDVVYGIRKKRKENVILRACYYLYYRLLRNVSRNLVIPLDAGDFCMMTRRVADILKAMPEKNRYLRGSRAWAGFHQVGVVYERDKRFSGKTKYSLPKLFALAFDGLTSFSQFPLNLCGYVGFTISILSFMGMIVVFISRFLAPGVPLGWASIISSVYFIGGIQLIMLSMVGAYIGRIYIEVQQRPLYVIKESGNLGKI